MSVHENQLAINKKKKRLFKLLVEVQIELNELKKKSSYDQELLSEIDAVRGKIDSLMERILTDP